uniref:Uncharacterized protein n=1 Tax=Panagrolaimus sp. ES5 TaxID=591445 RepID=A0AC34FBM5_9BILA
MATKDRDSSAYIWNHSDDKSSSSHDPKQYKNLNMNSNHGSSAKDFGHSESISTNNKSGKYDKINCRIKTATLTKVSDSNDYQNQSINDSWQTSNKRLYPNPSEYSNLHKPPKDEYNDEKKKEDVKNSSTLSLHISAYENTVEDGNQNEKENSDKTDANAKKPKKGKVSRAFKSIKNLFTGSPSKEFSKTFTFPEQSCTSETMEFKSSQKLLDPNKRLVFDFIKQQTLYFVTKRQRRCDSGIVQLL